MNWSELNLVTQLLEDCKVIRGESRQLKTKYYHHRKTSVQDELEDMKREMQWISFMDRYTPAFCSSRDEWRKAAQFLQLCIRYNRYLYLNPEYEENLDYLRAARLMIEFAWSETIVMAPKSEKDAISELLTSGTDPYQGFDFKTPDDDDDDDDDESNELFMIELVRKGGESLENLLVAKYDSERHFLVEQMGILELYQIATGKLANVPLCRLIQNSYRVASSPITCSIGQFLFKHAARSIMSRIKAEDVYDTILPHSVHLAVFLRAALLQDDSLACALAPIELNDKMLFKILEYGHQKIEDTMNDSNVEDLSLRALFAAFRKYRKMFLFQDELYGIEQPLETLFVTDDLTEHYTVVAVKQFVLICSELRSVASSSS